MANSADHGTGGDNPPSGGSSIQCAHNFVHLRSERVNIGYERNPTWSERDIFYCTSCLKYRTVELKQCGFNQSYGPFPRVIS